MAHLWLPPFASGCGRGWWPWRRRTWCRGSGITRLSLGLIWHGGGVDAEDQGQYNLVWGWWMYHLLWRKSWCSSWGQIRFRSRMVAMKGGVAKSSKIESGRCKILKRFCTRPLGYANKDWEFLRIWSFETFLLCLAGRSWQNKNKQHQEQRTLP